MEDLAPPLQLCVDLRFAIESGLSVYQSVQKSLATMRGDFGHDLATLMAAHKQGRAVGRSQFLSKSPYRQALLELIATGLKGEPIFEQIAEIEGELQAVCERELDDYIVRLPLKALLPMMLLQFPEFLLLVLGPIMTELIRGLNS